MKWSALAVLSAVVMFGAAMAVPTRAGAPLETALVDEFAGAGGELALDRVREAGASAVRLPMYWSSIAPAGSAAPAGFDPTDLESTSYRWTSFDQQISRATSRGLAPILSIADSPAWATVAPASGMEKTLPDPAELGKFALARILALSFFGGRR